MGSAVQSIATVREIRFFGDRDFLLTFHCPAVAAAARPGQFVEVRVSRGLEPFFRRPISIFDADEQHIRLLVRIVGGGTRMMAQWQLGEEVNIIGPLGNGFSLDSAEGECLLVGGGIGLAPLRFLDRELTRRGRTTHLLFTPKRDAQLLDCLEEDVRAGCALSDNRGTLGAAIAGMLEAHPAVGRIYTCGPDGMMRAVAQISLTRGIPAELSLETRMACGIGICIGCAVPVRDGADVVYRKACSDGPVFLASEVIFDV